MAGSAVWYHVLAGRKAFLLAPPSAANLAAHEAWAGSDRQADEGFAPRAGGCVRAELGPGDTLLLPAGWAHAVATPQDAFALGGNFLHALDLRCQPGGLSGACPGPSHAAPLLLRELHVACMNICSLSLEGHGICLGTAGSLHSVLANRCCRVVQCLLFE